MQILRSLALLSSLLGSISIYAKDPIGESGTFILDRARERTSALLTAGRADVEVDQFLPDDPKGASYNHHFNYEINVRFMGDKKGIGDLKLPAEFYQDDYLAKLRQEGEIVYEDYKIKHLGIETVETNGTEYPDADVVELYDFSMSQRLQVQEFDQMPSMEVQAQAPFAPQGTNAADAKIQNPRIKLALSPLAPMLGAVKVDVSGTYKGIFIRAGFDYQAPEAKKNELNSIREEILEMAEMGEL